MVNVGGNKVYPSEVENRLYEHPAVREAAVFGLPEVLLGEQVCACLVCTAGQSVSADELQAFCRQTLADFKVPSRIEFVEELPKGRTGKIPQTDLRDRFASAPPAARTRAVQVCPRTARVDSCLAGRAAGHSA
jgi:long-chain acyl-CoA synthetase